MAVSFTKGSIWTPLYPGSQSSGRDIVKETHSRYDYVSWGRPGCLTYAYGSEAEKKVVRGRTTYEEHAPRPSS